MLVPLNKSNVYGQGERGLSSVRAQGMRLEGNDSNSQQTLKVSSCDSGTKLSLGPDSYFTGGLIYSRKPTLGYVLLVPLMLLTVALAN